MAPRIEIATSIDEAAAAARGGAIPLAGATWIMRAPIRREPSHPRYVALSRIPALCEITADGQEIRIGASATHAEIARRLASLPECAGLVSAAARAANPAIRNVATIGGNLCAAAFPASDLAPALLSLDADVDIASEGHQKRIGIAEFLSHRTPMEGIVLRFVLPRSNRAGAHARLPLRKAGDYPVAIVSVTVDRGDGSLKDPKIAVGSVEAVARRWTELERALAGAALTPQQAFEAAEAMTGGFAARDGVEAPGWYRARVLPALVRRAFEALAQGAQG